MITINDQEKKALNDFLSEYFAIFTEIAENYLSNEEIEELAEKLME